MGAVGRQVAGGDAEVTWLPVHTSTSAESQVVSTRCTGVSEEVVGHGSGVSARPDGQHVVHTDARAAHNGELVTDGEAVVQTSDLDAVAGVEAVLLGEQSGVDVVHVARTKSGVEQVLTGEGGLQIQRQ